MAVDNPTVVQEASTASHEWKNVNSQVSALLASILQRIPKSQEQTEEQDKDQKEGQDGKEGQEKPKAKDKPRSVEIQVGKTKVFKGTEGQEPQKNTLTPAQVSALEKLVNTPSTEAGQELNSSVQSLSRVVTVRVDKEPVLRVANGQLDNQLAPEPQLEADSTPKLDYSKLLLDHTNSVPGYFDQEFTPEFVQNNLNDGHNISNQAFGESIDRWVVTEAIGQGIPKDQATNLVLEQSPYVQKMSEFKPGEFVRSYKDLDGYKDLLNAEADRILGKHLDAAQVKVTEPEQQPEPKVQTAPEPLELLGHQQPLGHQELEAKTSAQEAIQPEWAEQEFYFNPYKDPEELWEEEQIEQWEDRGIARAEAQFNSSQVQPEAEPQSEVKAAKHEPEPTVEAKSPHQASATEPTPEPVVESPISKAQTEVEEPETKLEPASEIVRPVAWMPSLSVTMGDSQNPTQMPIISQTTTEIEQKPEPTPKRSLGETLSKDFANSFDLPPETKEYFKQTGAAIKEGAKAVWAKLKVKVKETATAGVHQVKTQLQGRQAANTAVQLLNSDPEGRSFKGEDYNITAVNRHTISVTDAEQKEILRFEETPLGPKILKSDLTPKQLKEFAQVRGQIQKHGTENLLNTQPSARMQFLQGFAPSGDRAEVQQIHNNNTVSRVERIANTLKPTAVARNSETHELGDYAIERKGDNLQVRHKDRGVILSRTNGQIQGNLSDRDIAHIKGVNNRVSNVIGTEQQQVPVAAAAPAPTPSKTTKPSSPDIEMGE